MSLEIAKLAVLLKNRKKHDENNKALYVAAGALDVVIAGASEDGTMLVGEDLSLVCSVPALTTDPVYYYWTLPHTSQLRTDPVLELENMRSSDSGMYTCVAHSQSLGTGENSVVISVRRRMCFTVSKCSPRELF
jgi:hypothetical protein